MFVPSPPSEGAATSTKHSKILSGDGLRRTQTWIILTSYSHYAIKLGLYLTLEPISREPNQTASPGRHVCFMYQLPIGLRLRQFGRGRKLGAAGRACHDTDTS